MRDRDQVLLRVENWEELLTMGDPLAEVPAFATAEHPLHMYITVKALRKALKDSLYSISQNRARLDKTPELAAQTDALVEQRKAALAWLKQQPKEHVFMSLHPQTEWTFASVDGADDAGAETAEEGGDEPEAWRG
jgi:hypothetical protein